MAVVQHYMDLKNTPFSILPRIQPHMGRLLGERGEKHSLKKGARRCDQEKLDFVCRHKIVKAHDMEYVKKVSLDKLHNSLK